MIYLIYQREKGEQKMRATKLIDHLTKYYEDEYNQVVTAVESKYFKPFEVVDNAITRCLGVALFAQYLGIDFDELAEIDATVGYVIEDGFRTITLELYISDFHL